MQKQEYRCQCCNKLLAKGSVLMLEIKCVRCKSINQFN
ncbi:Com family DNA-binding transcriptional regulator [Mannheimia haemolytica]|nr:Com family DNA-binding transcriptional regulator [Mannheimia haemolytica]TRC48471.1 Com family DNA-binding transcriptional regulator [Mannheimia haemolytica]TRC49108.1 Com family DNA-binding transcriptional regulator [Mannheimia haemolytica]